MATLTEQDRELIRARREEFWSKVWPMFIAVLLANLATFAVVYVVLKVWIDATF